MSDTPGAIRRALLDIRDYYDEALEPPRLTSGVKLPTQAADAKMKYAAKVMVHSPAPVSLDVLEARKACHDDLMFLARVVLDEVTGIDGQPIQTRIDDPFNVPAIVAFLLTWADALCEQTCEGDRAAEDLTGHAKKLRGFALPDRRGWQPIGDCPVTIAVDGSSVPCGATVRAYDRSERVGTHFIECPRCGTSDTLDWWMSQIAPEGSDLATADGVIACVASRAGITVSHTQLWQWASRGLVKRHGKDTKGRTLYSSAAVLAYAKYRTKEEAA